MEFAALQRRNAGSNNDGNVRRQAVVHPEPSTVAKSHEQKVESALGAAGASLSPAECAEMGGLLGYDFSQVRIHADRSASEAAAALHASAFTVGQDIMFGAGYRPATPTGKALLAHELAHVVQQRGAPAPAFAIIAPHDPSERAAEAAAQAVVSGRPAASLSPVPAGALQRQSGEVHVAEHEAEVTERKAKLFARLRLNYASARRRNTQLAALPGPAAPGAIGWADKLDTVAGGQYRDLAALWSRGEYDAFADAVASRQFDLGLPEHDIDGILGLATWSRMAGLGEAMAAITTVSMSLCYQASEARLRRGYRLAAGRPLELPEDRNASIFQAVLASIPGRMLDVEEAYRGTGAAGALVYAGLGSFVRQDEIWTGALHPGAAMQVWAHRKAFDLLRAGEVKEGGKRRRVNDSDADFYGTSFVFVRYDTKGTDRILVRHFDSLEWHKQGDFAVWVAANSTL
jgi:Domain of unknown function (DUF4157)